MYFFKFLFGLFPLHASRFNNSKNCRLISNRLFSVNLIVKNSNQLATNIKLKLWLLNSNIHKY